MAEYASPRSAIPLYGMKRWLDTIAGWPAVSIAWLPLVSSYDTYCDMIRSFRGKFAETILRGRKVPKGFSAAVANTARRKLVQLNNAGVLGDLAAPPGNRLEALKGDLAGRHSIRINDQWRIVFRWTQAGPEEVEIVDYH